MSDLRICALGSPHIEHRGRLITVDTRKAIALLVYLAVEERQISRDTLATLLWPDYDQSRARAALRRTLSALHKALDESDDLAIERERVGLARSSSIWIDTCEFRQLLAQRRMHGHPAREVCVNCVTPLTQAIALYRDDFLSGFSLRDSPPFEEWQLIQRQALRDELAEALAALMRGYILRQAFAEAIPVARRWLALDRLNEQAHRFLMRLYDWSGQHAAALRQYRDCVQTLDQELGVAPLEATTRLYEAIREHRAPGPPRAPETHEPPDAPSPGAGDGDKSTRLTTPPASPAPGPVAHPVGRGALPLIGRAAEWEVIRNAYEARSSTGRLLVIEGEAGIGKTRLADELVAHARRLGGAVAAARCYEGEAEAGLAYAPVAALLRSSLGAEPAMRLRDLSDIWLSEALRLLPEFADIRPGVSTPPPLDNPGAQSRFFEGLRQALLATGTTRASPDLLLVDDAQWMDEASLDVLTYLIRRIEHQPLCIALTWRSGAVDARHRLRGLLAEAQRANCATHVTLHRLDEPSVREWLRAALDDAAGAGGQQHADDIAERLYQETEGLPFFISEYAIAFSSGMLAMDAQKWSTPTRVYDLLRSRLHALSEMAWQTLTAAAALGRSFDFDTVRETSGRNEEETAAALEELTAHGLIGEVPETSHGEIDYDFTHDKLRALVYEETSLARRRLLHRRAAEALAVTHRRHRQGTERAAEIAQHYIAAGNEMAAATYFKLAGERARGLYANADALRHFQAALALGHPDVAGLHEAMGEAYTLRGEYAMALTSYKMAAANRSQGTAPIEHKIGLVHLRRGEWEAARSHFETALAALGETGTDGERARIYADWSLVARRQGHLEEAQVLGEQALGLATAGADALALAQAHNILGILASGRGEPERAVSHLEESLALAEHLGDQAARAAALNNLALALSGAGQTERALPLAEAALALCVALGDRHHEAALHNTLADLLHAVGHAEDAMAHLKQAVAIYAEIGVEAGAVQPGIWNMAEW